MDKNKTRLTVHQIVARKPRGYVAILSHFERLVKLDIERRSARIESAMPLDATMEGAVRTNLVQKYGPGLNLSFGHNPALLGGLRIQVGSDVYDGSIAARLNSLAESF